jgi:hypothetical protein
MCLCHLDPMTASGLLRSLNPAMELCPKKPSATRVLTSGRYLLRKISGATQRCHKAQSSLKFAKASHSPGSP